jgi:hypothetical protein
MGKVRPAINFVVVLFRGGEELRLERIRVLYGLCGVIRRT